MPSKWRVEIAREGGGYHVRKPNGELLSYRMYSCHGHMRIWKPYRFTWIQSAYLTAALMSARVGGIEPDTG